METFFDLVPEELLVLILHNINTYKDFINLNEIITFNKIFNNEYFWKKLFNESFGDLIKSVSINFDNLDIYYISSMYIKALNAYIKTINRVKHMIKTVNKDIKKYYPEMNMDNIDIGKIEEDKYELLIEQTINFDVDGKYIKNESLLFYKTNEVNRNFKKRELGEFLSKYNGIDSIILYEGVAGFSMSVFFDMPIFVGVMRAHLYTPLTKNEFIKILLHVYFNGYVEK